MKSLFDILYPNKFAIGEMWYAKDSKQPIRVESAGTYQIRVRYLDKRTGEDSNIVSDLSKNFLTIHYDWKE